MAKRSREDEPLSLLSHNRAFPLAKKPRASDQERVVISLIDSDEDVPSVVEKTAKICEIAEQQAFRERNDLSIRPDSRYFSEASAIWDHGASAKLPSSISNEIAQPKHQKIQKNVVKGKPKLQHSQSFRDDIEWLSRSGTPVSQASTLTASLPATETVLCKEQADLVDLILSGRNVFYTGSAGCGKSTVLKAFVRKLRDMGRMVNIIAPTGRAALDIGGSTTWTYAGMTPDHHKKPLTELKRNAHGKFVRKRLMATHVLVIDEISMVENHHLERLNHIMKEARGSPRAFGGVQLVVTGDFCQLPPVKPFQYCMECGHTMSPVVQDVSYKCPKHGEFQDIDKWAFRSAAWKEANFKHVNLTTIHRQSDRKFISILNRCRYGIALGTIDKSILLKHTSDTKNAVKLFPTREEVARVNNAEFARLTSKKRTYGCYDHFRHNPDHRHLAMKSQRTPQGSLVALRDHRFDTTIELKEGMLVVLLVNLSLAEGLVNGSQGIVTGFVKHEASHIPKKPDRGDGTKGTSQGVHIPTLGGEYAELREECIKQFIKQAAIKEWPIVRFNNGVERPIIADCTVNELGDMKPYSLLSRTQIPLTAAWAMTVHKSQGMTLDRVIVDLSKSFEEGQIYVALSRARSLEGLKVDGLGDFRGGGNPQVKEFLSKNCGITFPTD